LDNVTHSLVGLLCAEIAVRVRERRAPLQPWSRASFYAVAIIGNNLPDLDFSYSRISGKTFGYLLQHRGYTHTLPAVLGFALAQLGVLWVLAKWRGRTLPGTDWAWLTALAVASPLLHLGMDFANNYGVHPFWPVYSGWFYGDSFFILEPSFWLALTAPLSLSYRSRWVRGALWLVVGLALGALWYEPFVPRRNALALSLITLVLFGLARRLTPFGRSYLAAGGFVLLAAAFIGGSRVAKATASRQARVWFASAVTLDIVATPTPANPFCWSVILVQREGAEYVVRLARAATWPAWLTVAECPYDRASTPTAPLDAARSAHFDERLLVQSEYRVPAAELATLMRERCEARAFLRFARVPYLTPWAPDGSRVLGDLRYDRSPGLDFSDIRLARAQGRCPEYVPPWLPPRAETLDSPVRGLARPGF
jgi:inner membrane protein